MMEGPRRMTKKERRSHFWRGKQSSYTPQCCDGTCWDGECTTSLIQRTESSKETKRKVKDLME
jgi:hypothetical protein